MPQAVMASKDKDALLSIGESKIVPVLVEAVNQLGTMNHAQQGEIEKRQQRVSALERMAGTRAAANNIPAP